MPDLARMTAPSPPRLVAPRATLRAATRDAHDAAERVPLLAALSDGTLSLERYAAMLAALVPMFDAWEHHYATFLARDAFASGWRYASRSALLHRDIEDLGVAAGEDADATTSVPLDDRVSTAWGMLYVIEGSTLGGRVLAGRARRAMPMLTATRYLEAGTHEPRYWPRFAAILDAALASGASIDAATHGARAMFALYQRTLESVR